MGETIHKWRKHYEEDGVHGRCRKASSIAIRKQCSALEQKIIALRRENALTQSRLADLLGVSLRSLRRWERGERPVPHLVELALPEMRRRLSHARRLREYRERRRRREHLPGSSLMRAAWSLIRFG